MNFKSAIAITTAVGFAACAIAADVDISKLPAASAKTGVTYATDIKPIFDASCIKCHGKKKPKGKLRLDTLAGTLKGGVDGKVFEPGNSAKSFLVANIAFLGDADDFMPPPKDKKYPKFTPEE